ncbi:MAG: class I SAM-dependent methyltransferase [Saprospiraceae bacterium]|nr:class I SAM-dependent methyltransferase [Saprospiraceae bacterium]
MRDPIDLFSRHSRHYKTFRPSYPSALYHDVLSFTSGRKCCWDCATGNGQVAVEMAKHFQSVCATDISRHQLLQSPTLSNIHYVQGRAEKTAFDDASFDLITVGQALHWFDHLAFNMEAKRVLRPGGSIAVWTYGILRISPSIDAIIDEFYRDVIGPYWAPERSHVDSKYADIPFDFSNVRKFQYRLQLTWTLRHLEGYINTWSSVQKYKETNGEKNPVKWIMDRIDSILASENSLTVEFPLFLQIGQN